MDDFNEIDFSDITVNEGEGVFEQICEIMSRDSYNEEWVIRTEASILSSAGMGNMTLQMHKDGSIYILDYYPSTSGDVFYNPDIGVLSSWAQENGWKVPQPHFDLVKKDKVFWKHFYDALVVDSDYLDGLYGKRDQLADDK